MGWDGYYAYNGAEFINAERTEQYLLAERVPWFRPQFNTNALSVLEGADYENPIVDSPPWGDPDNPDTYRFWGCYPLRITGISDSTREAAVTENIGDGGVVGPLRAATRAVVFECALFGADECAVETGMAWLKSVLTSGPCDEGSGELCYFACNPCVPEECDDEPGTVHACTDVYRRTLREVRFVSGPTITGTRRLSDGSFMWVVTFTAVAGVASEFGPEIDLVEGFMVAPDPWVPAVTPADWQFSTLGNEVEDANCAQSTYEPIVDPLCPQIEVPPPPPSVDIACYTPPESWARRWFTIPRKYVPYWGDAVPVIRIEAPSEEVRNLRLRFYADIDGTANIDADPCAYCGDIVFSFIPADHTLVFDGAVRSIYAEGPGGIKRRADSLVFKSDGTPFEWPVLSCGFGYVVTVDLPYGGGPSDLPSVDLSLIPKAAA